MAHYIDSFIFPIAEKHLATYKSIALEVAQIWKEHGALEYSEFMADDLFLEGTRSYSEIIKVQEHEVILVGWVKFPSKEIRDDANKQVPLDDRMKKLVSPLMEGEPPIFDASRMIYGGFKELLTRGS